MSIGNRLLINLVYPVLLLIVCIDASARPMDCALYKALDEGSVLACLMFAIVLGVRFQKDYGTRMLMHSVISVGIVTAILESPCTLLEFAMIEIRILFITTTLVTSAWLICTISSGLATRVASNPDGNSSKR